MKGVEGVFLPHIIYKKNCQYFSKAKYLFHHYLSKAKNYTVIEVNGMDAW